MLLVFPRWIAATWQTVQGDILEHASAPAKLGLRDSETRLSC